MERITSVTNSTTVSHVERLGPPTLFHPGTLIETTRMVTTTTTNAITIPTHHHRHHRHLVVPTTTTGITTVHPVMNPVPGDAVGVIPTTLTESPPAGVAVTGTCPAIPAGVLVPAAAPILALTLVRVPAVLKGVMIVMTAGHGRVRSTVTTLVIVTITTIITTNNSSSLITCR